MKLKLLVTGALITIIGLLTNASFSTTPIPKKPIPKPSIKPIYKKPISKPSIKPIPLDQSALNNQLKQALCVQDWQRSIQILDTMKKAFPAEIYQLTLYQRQISAWQRSHAKIPNWPSDCAISPPGINPMPTTVHPKSIPNSQK